MPNEITIPILPCRGITEMLEFYVALGFEVTYQQSRPNSYACVQRGAIDLHFFSMREYVPANSYSTCLVLVPDVEALYQEFRAGLRQHYGKLPAAGIPRLTSLRDKAEGGRGFNVIDPGGNWIRISQIRVPGEEGEAGEIQQESSVKEKTETTKLARAIYAAELLAESKGDDAAAAKMLDNALAQEESAPASQYVQAWVARAGLAITLGEAEVARTLLAKVQQIVLGEEDRASLHAELGRANDFEQMLA